MGTQSSDPQFEKLLAEYLSKPPDQAIGAFVSAFRTEAANILAHTRLFQQGLDREIAAIWQGNPRLQVISDAATHIIESGESIHKIVDIMAQYWSELRGQENLGEQSSSEMTLNLANYLKASPKSAINNFADQISEATTRISSDFASIQHLLKSFKAESKEEQQYFSIFAGIPFPVARIERTVKMARIYADTWQEKFGHFKNS